MLQERALLLLWFCWKLPLWWWVLARAMGLQGVQAAWAQFCGLQQVGAAPKTAQAPLQEWAARWLWLKSLRPQWWQRPAVLPECRVLGARRCVLRVKWLAAGRARLPCQPGRSTPVLPQPAAAQAPSRARWVQGCTDWIPGGSPNQVGQMVQG